MSDQYQELETAILAGDVGAGASEALRLAEAGVSPTEIFSNCIEPTLAVVGDKFSRLEIFLPEMVNAANVVKVVQETLQPFMEADGPQLKKGRLVIGTVSGDLHDIGKNIVKAMLEVNGFEVLDLGVDVNPAVAVKSAVDFEADIIAFSALMLPSLPYVKDAIAMVKENEKYRERFKIMVGGGPVSEEWAVEAGADAYGDDAVEAVQVALALVGARD